MKNEVTGPEKHAYGYDHAIRTAGVRLIEIETAEELEKAMSDRTAMMFLPQSSDLQGENPSRRIRRIGKKHNIPT